MTNKIPRDMKDFFTSYKQAFGDMDPPIAFWYSAQPATATKRVGGCFVRELNKVRGGSIVSFSAEDILCRGGKLYTGFGEASPNIGNFVSQKECHKQTPEMVHDFINDLNIRKREEEYLNFSPLDKVKDIESIEGVIFFATPDVLSGLVSWTLYDSNDPNAIVTPFGSGCSSLITQVIKENEQQGNRVFLGLFDPSVRPHFDENLLSLSIPRMRFLQMMLTIDNTCLQGKPAWRKVKERIQANDNI